MGSRHEMKCDGQTRLDSVRSDHPQDYSYDAPERFARHCLFAPLHRRRTSDRGQSRIVKRGDCAAHCARRHSTRRELFVRPLKASGQSGRARCVEAPDFA